MSIFDAVTNLVSGLAGGGNADAVDHSAVAGGLLQELGGAGGIGGLIQTMQQNGGGNLVQEIASGNTSSIDPNQLTGLLQGTGLIDNVAGRTGLSPQMIQTGLATVLPALLNHTIANGHVTADGQTGASPLPDAGSLLTSILGKLA